MRRRPRAKGCGRLWRLEEARADAEAAGGPPAATVWVSPAGPRWTPAPEPEDSESTRCSAAKFAVAAFRSSDTRWPQLLSPPAWHTPLHRVSETPTVPNPVVASGVSRPLSHLAHAGHARNMARLMPQWRNSPLAPTAVPEAAVAWSWATGRAPGCGGGAGCRGRDRMLLDGR